MAPLPNLRRASTLAYGGRARLPGRASLELQQAYSGAAADGAAVDGAAADGAGAPGSDRAQAGW
jgi:hypothetical protein